ncbi:DUF4974 domain-containing protein [Chitinophaga oryzae]|uniref:DUF4974 domain-containing protein n=1 Tax=Chitinophaga oryzae TaxID=2725414 RepID=A0AAE6ZBY8_9BACT|nr:DUF4974 domain-containing protein [Chitinophaga oryzae]QJB30008.1 DUF4974 domain-containing protein [Chitinophaga oryzae]QJB36505.1 DUF4974 domain-containing protein [Chitinophaga oryzae]
MSDKETKELFDLMDQVPNARRVAREYRRLMKEGKLDPKKDVTDAGAGWLAIEDELNQGDEAKSYNYTVPGICISIILAGLCLSGWWQNRHEKEVVRQLAFNERAGAALRGPHELQMAGATRRKDGVYTFHDASLNEIRGMIDKRFAIKVIFDEPEMSLRRFTGCMDPCQSLDAFMNVVKYSSAVDYYFQGSTLHIRASQ